MAKSVIFHNTNNDHLVVKVFPQHDLQVSTSVGFVLYLWVVFEHFFLKMYITITDVVMEKSIDPANQIGSSDSSKEQGSCHC